MRGQSKGGNKKPKADLYTARGWVNVITRRDGSQFIACGDPPWPFLGLHQSYRAAMDEAKRLREHGMNAKPRRATSVLSVTS